MTETVELAPPGTYEHIHTLLGCLGNDRTKRYIIVYKMQVLSDQQLVDVLGLSVRLRHGRGMEQHTLFFISSEDQILGVSAYSFESKTSPPQEIPPPTLAESLREVKIAERYQPRLKIQSL